MSITRDMCKKKSHDLLTTELEAIHLKQLEQRENHSTESKIKRNKS